MFKNISLTKKITGSMVLMLISMGFINGVQFQNVISEIKDQDKESIEINTTAFVDSISAQFYERYGDVQAFGFNPILHGNDTQAMSKLLDQYAAAYGIYDVILVADLHGKVIATNVHSPVGKTLSFKNLENPNLGSQEWFQKVSKGEFTQDSEKELSGTLITAPKFESWITKLYGEQRYTNVFASLMNDENGKPFRVVVNYANFKWLEGELTNLSQSSARIDHKFKNMKTYLLDHDGVVIAQYSSGEKEDKNIQRDEMVLGKLNLVTNGNPAAISLQKSEVGVIQGIGNKSENWYGFKKINGKKFSEELGWSVVTEIPSEDITKDFQGLVYFFYGILIVSIVLLILGAYFYYNKIGTYLAKRVDAFTGVSKVVEKNAEQMKFSAGQLSEASSEQASAIQESVSALSEISSMISQTNENTKLSLISTSNIVERSVAGREIMNKLGHSMDSISEANSSLQEIAEIISSINQKTSVINEIVFKTQLLSFNASIEAARAGQYGKGFAVVAEEVGNLAQMSGDAAREIELLITNSEKKVDSTLGLIQRRVKEGSVVSAEAVNAFNGISVAITEIKNQVKSIADATVQQDVGIVQTQKAMALLDESARKTCSLANDMKSSSGVLEDVSLNLSTQTREVAVLVHGSSDVDSKTMDHSNSTEIHETEQPEEMPVDFIDNTNVTADDDSFRKAA